MRMKLILLFQLLMILLIQLSCSVPVESDPLPSWNEGKNKSAIINYVNDVTNKNSLNFIPIAERIAVFDNDGTLWTEKPIYFQVLFVFDRIREMYKEHPEWKEKQPYKAVLENDLKTLLSFGSDGLSGLFVETHTGMSTSEFTKIVKEWFESSKHSKYDRYYTELVFQPMLELMNYLRGHEFKTYIVSGGGQTFVRSFAEEIYGIPPEQVIGTLFKTNFVIENGKPEIFRAPEIFLFDDKEVKPVAIEKFIGRIPVIAFGNSDGDLQMLQYTQSGKGKRFMAIVHHTDGEREYAYDRDSKIGHLDKAWDEAIKNNWNMIDMKSDWKVIYPFELEKL